MRYGVWPLATALPLALPPNMLSAAFASATSSSSKSCQATQEQEISKQLNFNVTSNFNIKTEPRTGSTGPAPVSQSSHPATRNCALWQMPSTTINLDILARRFSKPNSSAQRWGLQWIWHASQPTAITSCLHWVNLTFPRIVLGALSCCPTCWADSRQVDWI